MFEVEVEGKKYKVSFQHVKNTTSFTENQYGQIPWPFSYVTECNIYNFEDEFFYVDGSYGIKWYQNFCRNSGRKMAMGRALQAFPREQRKPFWDKYFETRHGKY